jgi:2-hydroxychromene-2-carboxylate isomerase
MKAFNIPMSDEGPKPFPQPTLNTQRALCAIETAHPDKLSDCFGALYQAFWVESQTIGKPEVFGPVLAKVLGEQGAKEIVEASKGPDAKGRLSKNSDWAMEEGAFGLPWFVCTNAKGELMFLVFLDVIADLCTI